MELMCPRCQETRQVEVVKTAQRREAFCATCGHHWPFRVTLCACAAVPVLHTHPAEDPLPPCPKCGNPAQQSKPA